MRGLIVTALVYATTVVSSLAALVDAGQKTIVTANADAWDTRVSGSGCSPSGCVPANTRDGSIAEGSRWSCKEDLLNNEQCVIHFTFLEPQDIVELKIAFYKGDERTRRLKILLNNRVYSTINSSGVTSDFETFVLNSDETSSISLEGLGMAGDEWISITEVKFMVEGEGTPSPTPSLSEDCDPALAIVLEWDNESDLDLHVVEPSGELVHHSNNVGDFGWLTDDDMDGFGPEAYILRSDLDLAQDGILGYYEARIEYISGDLPVTWSSTAMVGGEIVMMNEGTITQEPYSYSFTVDLDTYEEPDCDFLPPTPAPFVVGNSPTLSSMDADCDAALTISLEWFDGTSDFDLHVTEPGGEHVFFGNRLGEVGYLDRDDTSGFGPETYFVRSGLSVGEDDVIGEYVAYVDLWNGNPPLSWRLTASLHGKLFWVEEGETTVDNRRSGNFAIILEDYDDSPCIIEPLAGAVAPDEPLKKDRSDLTSKDEGR